MCHHHEIFIRPHVHRVLAAICVATLFTTAGRGAQSEEPTQKSADSPSPAWQSDYTAAYAEADRERRMFVVHFVESDPQGELANTQLDEWIAARPALQAKLRQAVLVRVSEATQVSEGGKRVRLLDHPAFRDLGGGAGIALIDLRDPDQPFHGQVVTALPFASGKYYRWENSYLDVAMDLPPGTLSQRTMIWAIRVHPESPQSTSGEPHVALANAAADQSAYQARLGVQGHHRWETRFFQICAAADAKTASEVVAESWPNEGLVDACIDCVASWRYSPGHWQAVRTRHRLFGYDIRRGRNGIWYGTGIFAN